MLELMLRIETLLLGLDVPILLGAGGGVLLVGLLLWLSGDRYGSAIIGLMGAVVGSGCGLLVGQWLGYDLRLSMILGAALLALVSALLRNVLVVVLAMLVVATLSSGGYIALQMDQMMQDSQSPSEVSNEQQGPSRIMQSFNSMGVQERQAYLNEIAGDKKGFFEKLRALLADTWQRMSPHATQLGLSALAGGIGALVLIWIVKRAIVILAYSVVGSMSTVLGLQTLLLGLHVKAVSALNVDQWTLPIGFGVMVLAGGLSQFVLKRPGKHKVVHEIEESASEETDSDND